MAIGKEDPSAAPLAHRAFRSLVESKSLESFGPDGAYPEGIVYWGYATNYLAYLASSLQTALGNDFNLTHSPGLEVTGLFPIYCEGTSGRMFNFADAKDGRIFPYWMSGLAAAYGNPLFAWYAQQHLGIHVMDLIWYDQRGRDSGPFNLPTAKKFRGPEIAVFRGAWEDSNAAYLALKTGSPATEHSHLDTGSFVFDALGIRWAMDLGPDIYDLPGYFTDWNDTTRRFDFYRIRAQGNNTLTINPGMAPDQKRISNSG